MAMPGFLIVYGYYEEEAGKWAIGLTIQQLISSLMTIGTFVGSLLGGPFSSEFGRRRGGGALVPVTTKPHLNCCHDRDR